MIVRYPVTEEEAHALCLVTKLSGYRIGLIVARLNKDETVFSYWDAWGFEQNLAVDEPQEMPYCFLPMRAAVKRQQRMLEVDEDGDIIGAPDANGLRVVVGMWKHPDWYPDTQTELPKYQKMGLGHLFTGMTQ